MKVIFLQNIKGIAQIGDIKIVSDGYGRNFLLPRKLAQLATGSNSQHVANLKQRYTADLLTQQSRAQEAAEKLKDVVLTFTEDSNSEGHLYGSITASYIVKALKKQGIDIEEGAIELPYHLKKIGEYTIPIDLYPGVQTEIKINVIAKT